MDNINNENKNAFRIYTNQLFLLNYLPDVKAAYLNHQGTGQVLVYPYYTVNNDLNTLISVVNTTDDVKALKVRFLEGDNGQAVLSFNLYMGPYDVWTGALFADDSGVDVQTGAALATADNSCAPFLANPQSFLPFAFVLDPGSDDEEREREGYFVIAEMGVVSDPVLGPAATLQNGVPNNCAALQDAWLVGNQWDLGPNQGISAATGGLYGHAMVIDVAEGTAIAYRAETIEDFYPEGGFLQTDPGNIEPTWNSARPQSMLIDSGEAIVSDWDSGLDAISALFMHDSIFNEFVLASGIEAQTEWVLTFPTKASYVFGDGPTGPFRSVFDGPDGACEYLTRELFDRESQEAEPTAQVTGTPPPGVDTCWSTNVVRLYNSDIGQMNETVSPLLGSTNTVGLNSDPFNAGFVQLTPLISGSLEDVDANYTYTGYPMIGFAVQSYTNNNAQPGLLAQYAALFKHTYKRNITSGAE